ncbi:M28 family metallopeptidase [Cohnella sp.]|uniref:M28 family metallopeptidase n=1 Tax=Cohnella sp. TaxID=1883426 RepID=UPI0035685454
MKRKTRFFLFPLLLTLTACNLSSEPEKKITGGDYPSIIHDLTKPDMGGRLTGTVGNHNAEDFISEHFRNIGLDPFSRESYAMTYEHEDNTPDSQSLELKITYRNGSSDTFQYGSDYLEQKIPFSYENSGIYTFDPNDPELPKRILIVKSTEELNKLQDKSPLMVFVAKETFKRYLLTQSSDIPTLQISKEKYELLKEKQSEIEKVALKSDIKTKKATASNIAGVIKGAGGHDHREAIILSAHFDSLGSVGDLKYQGATDNATGVSALIQLAYNLKTHSSKHSLHPDIVFAAFNGEESGRQGSKAFVEEILESKHYSQIYNINLDCIGVKDGGSYLLIGNEPNSGLAVNLEQYFGDHDFPLQPQQGGFESDHNSFAERQIHAVTIGQENVPFIHTSNDTVDKIDYDSLQQFVTALFNFVISVHHIEETEQAADIEAATLSESEIADFEKAQQAITDALRVMRLGQYQIIGDKKQSYTVVNNHAVFDQVHEAEQLIEGLSIPEKWTDYAFDSVGVNTNFQLTPEKIHEADFNQIYQFDNIAPTNIQNIDLIYKMNTNEYLQIYISREPSINEAEHENSAQITTESLEYKNKQYDVHSADRFIFITTEVEIEDKTFYVKLMQGRKTDQDEVRGLTLSWSIEDKESALSIAHDLQLEDLLRTIGI